MNRKILFTAILTAALVSSLFFGLTASFWNTHSYVAYRFDAVLSDPVTNISVNPPIMTIDGYRPASGIQSVEVTINGVTYTYPEDFSYNETFHIEANQLTNKSVITVTTTLIFNLPNMPTLTEYMTSQATRYGSTIVTDEGVFYVTGSGIFSRVNGGGFVTSTGDAATSVDYARHIGLINGWPI